jgi:hypothetical protein
MKFAIPTPVLSGEKKDVSFLLIDIKDIEKGDIANFEKIVLENISSNKGFVNQEGENEVLSLFYDALDAAKAALDIMEKTGPINVIMGIGLHMGPTVISESEVLKYSTMGNTIITLRRLAKKSKKNILMSKEIKNMLGNSIIIDKTTEDFILKSISRREDFKKDVERIVKNIKSEGKGFEVVR